LRIQKALSGVWFLVSAAAAFAAPDLPQFSAALPGASNSSTLTNATQILQLSPEQANAKPPVRIQGVVTCYDHGRVLFVQDETAGVFVYHTGGRLSLRPGHHVRVSGVANRGRYSPIVVSPVIQPAESGPAIQPRSVSLAQIQFGDLDAQWVETDAVVRSQKIIDGRLLLEIADPPSRVRLWIVDHDGFEQLPLIGSSVRVRGVVGASVRDGGQLEGFQIFANALADVTVLRSHTEDPISIPLRPIGELARRDGRSIMQGPIRVRGAVTLRQPGRAVFIQDDSGGLEVLTKAPLNDMVLGTVVEATGYAGPILEPVRLEDAQLRILATNSVPQVVNLSAEDLFQSRYNSRLVEIKGRFLGRAATSNSLALEVQAEGRFLTALLDAPEPNATLTALEPGCTLRLIGVCRFGKDSGNDSTASLLLRSPTDVKVISPPAANRTPALPALVTATILTGAGLVVALWFLQKQHSRADDLRGRQAALELKMHQSEQQLRHSIEERERIGRDLHDDIIQSIYAAGLGLEDCRRVVRQSPEQAEARLGAAIQTLNNTILGVRSFIAGLEPKVLNGREFKTALKSLALTSGDSPTQFQFQVDPTGAGSLTSTQATQLLHIAKEAMSNSLRHAHASSVTVSLQSDGPGVRLEIRDDGVGFDPGTVGSHGQGLRNIAARAREVGAELQIISSPGQGCRTLVTVPQRNSDERD
jgi:signal transduction histidine kinase